MAKGSDNAFPSLLLAEQGSAPATPSAGQARLFIDSADGLFKWVDDAGTVTPISGATSTLTTEGDLLYHDGSGLQRLPVGSDDDVLTVAAGVPSWAPSAGGGGGWTLDVDLPGTSLTDWTASGGSWSASGAGIRQATDSSSIKRLLYGPKVNMARAVAEAEINVATSSNTASSRAGFSFGGAGGMECSLFCGVSGFTNSVDFEVDSSTNAGQAALASNIAHTTWITFRVEIAGPSIAAYVNGTLIDTGYLPATAIRRWGNFTLYSYATDCSFRNLKYWSLTQP